jgi:hypothetical protein
MWLAERAVGSSSGTHVMAIQVPCEAIEVMGEAEATWKKTRYRTELKGGKDGTQTRG